MSAKARLATNVRTLIAASGGHQTAAAKEMGVSGPWLSDIVNEKLKHFDRLDVLAKHFNIDVSILLFPPEILMRDLARHTCRDTKPLLTQKGGPSHGEDAPSIEIPTEDEVLDAVDALVALLQRFRLAHRGP